eukprot:TRINITY_DN17259_c0_g1_i1.p1 TRINITY_DN17259_c0_g1~~TRINITY_DN17259_c0_g1_i1.p1  ORF type:complete len:530 (+),score=132.81 TRINITY_DN17259_c0_g1_i1:61-1590(+)
MAQATELRAVPVQVLAEMLTHFTLREVTLLRTVCTGWKKLIELDFVMREVLLNEVGRSDAAASAAFLEHGVPLLPPTEEAARAAPPSLVSQPLPRLDWSRWVALIRSKSHDLTLARARGFRSGVLTSQRCGATDLIQPCMGMHAIELEEGMDQHLIFGGGWYSRFDSLTVFTQRLLSGDGKLRSLGNTDQGEVDVEAPFHLRLLYGCGACRVSRDELIVFGGGTYHECYNGVVAMSLVRGEDGTVEDVTWKTRKGPRVVGTRTALNVVQTDDGSMWPCERFGHSLVNYNGKCVLFGGRVSHHHLGDVWLLDPVTLKWELKECSGHPPSPRIWHKAVVVGSKMLIVGGSCWFQDQDGWPADLQGIHELDLDTWHWKHRPGSGQVPTGFLQQGVSRVGGCLIVSGGFSPQFTSYTSSVWVCNLATDVWRKVGHLRKPRASHVQVATAEAPGPECAELSWTCRVYAGGMYMRRDFYSDFETFSMTGEPPEARESGGGGGFMELLRESFNRRR